jgi:hypothetical protein
MSLTPLTPQTEAEVEALTDKILLANRPLV